MHSLRTITSESVAYYVILAAARANPFREQKSIDRFRVYFERVPCSLEHSVTVVDSHNGGVVMRAIVDADDI